MSDVRSLHTWSCHKSYYLLDTGDFLFMLSPNAAVRLRINNRLHGTVRHDIANPQSLIILHPFLHIRTHLRTHIQAPALAGKGDGASLAGSHTRLESKVLTALLDRS